VIHIAIDGNQASTNVEQTTEAPENAITASAETLVRRAPMGFLWNQLFQLWLFGSGLLLMLVVARGVTKDQYGAFQVALTAFNTALYIAAFGLEEAATIWVPRALAEHGRGQASSVIRRLLSIRLLFLLVVCASMLFLLPVAPAWLNHLPIPGVDRLANALDNQAIQQHLPALACYVSGIGVVNLLFSVFTALLRTRVTLVISGLSQAGNLALAWFLLRLGWGVDGALWALGIVAWVTAVGYLFWLAPLLFARSPRQPISLRPALRLGAAAWLTNLANGALIKQVAVWLLLFYLGSQALASVGFFSLAFQLGHSAGLLLIAGLSGVGMATMAAAYAGENRAWLATSWRAVLKVQILLSLPLLVIALLNAQAIIILLFGRGYADVAPLLQLFLVFNILTQLSGGNTHQAALYVLGRQRVVVALQWGGLALTALLGVALIPFTGPMGALIATGVPPVLINVTQLALIWPALHRGYPLRFVARYAMAMLAPFLVGLAIDFFFHPAGFIGLAAASIIFTILLVGALLVIKPLEVDDALLVGKLNSWLRRVLLLFIRKSALRAANITAVEEQG
jgi:O-antigen/teichoic acid export membrane protein